MGNSCCGGRELNEKWFIYCNPPFHYKAQEYENSCFPACLQMLLANFNLIEPKGNIIETLFQEQYNLDLQKEAPILEQCLSFIKERNYPGGEHIYFIKKTDDIKKDDHEYIQRLFEEQDDLAIIGAEKGTSHATMIIKNNGIIYAVSPSFRESAKGGIYDSSYFCEIISVENIEFFEEHNKIATGAVLNCHMEYFIQIKKI